MLKKCQPSKNQSSLCPREKIAVVEFEEIQNDDSAVR